VTHPDADTDMHSTMLAITAMYFMIIIQALFY